MPNHEKIERVSEAVYDVLAGYAKTFDQYSHGWHEAPLQDREEIRAIVSEVVKAGCMVSADEIHAGWMGHRRATGWVWGPIEDSEYLKHPNLLRYDQLPPWERIRAVLILEVIKAISAYYDAVTPEEGVDIG